MVRDGYQDWSGMRALPEECAPNDLVDVILEDGRELTSKLVSEFRWVYYANLRERTHVRPRGNIIAWRFSP